MKSMLISEKEKKDMAESSVIADTPKYPYGLKLHFNEESYSKLELPDVPKVGQKFMVLAYAEVCDVSMNKNIDDRPNVNFSLQIMDVDLKEKEKKEEKSAADTLYGSGE